MTSVTAAPAVTPMTAVTAAPGVTPVTAAPAVTSVTSVTPVTAATAAPADRRSGPGRAGPSAELTTRHESGVS